MDTEWGGLETLIAAAKFVELQEQEKNQKLIEICEEYPSSEKSSYSTESASSLTPVQSNVASPSPPTISLIAPRNVTPQTSTSYTNTDISCAATNSHHHHHLHHQHLDNGINNNSNSAAATAANILSGGNNNYTLSTIASLPTTLTNGCSNAVAISTLPSFSPSPALTFTFTTPSNAAAAAANNSQTPSLLKIPSPSLATTTVTAATTTIPQQQQSLANSRLLSASLPRHHTSPLVIQRANSSPPPLPPSASSSPSLLPPSRTVQHHSPVAHQHQHQQQSLQNSMSAIAIIPHRTYNERTANVTDIKRKLSASGTREVHNKLEKNRRAHLKECFELLKSQVPAIQDEKKPSNLTILRTAIRYVQILRRREQELESELERLAREKIINQQRLTTLKKELSAQWDHIDFNSLLPESVESKPNVTHENGGVDQRDYEMERDADKIAVMSDADDSSQVKSRGDTYYGSSSSTGSCSISPLHISSPNVVSTTSDSLPPQIHIVESAAVPFEKLSNTTVVSPLQFLSTSTLRMITDSEPIALVQHNGGKRNSTVLTTVPVHTNVGNIVNHSFVVTQPSSGQVLLTSASPHIPTNVMPTPLLKTVSRLQPINGHQLVVKPAMVVVSTAAAASK